MIACQFEQRANEVVAALPWVKKVNVTMSAQPAAPIFSEQLPAGLQKISSIIAVSSCKVYILLNVLIFCPQHVPAVKFTVLTYWTVWLTK